MSDDKFTQNEEKLFGLLQEVIKLVEGLKVISELHTKSINGLSKAVTLIKDAQQTTDRRVQQ